MNYTLFCDGAFSSSRNQGGIGIVFLKDGNKILEYSRMFKNTTNNQMEMLALIIGLKCIKHSISSLLIVTDSMYCVGCATLNWKRNKNKKLWELFDKEFERVKQLCPNITFKHVRGHQKDDSEMAKWNNFVDKLARNASQLL